MLRQFILTILLSITFAPCVLAQECFDVQQAEAEQGIRIHSELMVIGLNCAHKKTEAGDGLYASYRAFTGRHADLFSKYEQILMDYFKGTGNEDPEGTLNTLRTKFANKISNDAAKMRPDVFCSRYAPRISQASAMDHETVRKWASTIFPSHPVSRPVCQVADKT